MNTNPSACNFGDLYCGHVATERRGPGTSTQDTCPYTTDPLDHDTPKSDSYYLFNDK